MNDWSGLERFAWILIDENVETYFAEAWYLSTSMWLYDEMFAYFL